MITTSLCVIQKVGLNSCSCVEFLTQYIEKFPDTTRKFSIPNGVYRGNYKGESAYYTTKSPLPKANMKFNESEIIF